MEAEVGIGFMQGTYIVLLTAVIAVLGYIGKQLIAFGRFKAVMERELENTQEKRDRADDALEKHVDGCEVKNQEVLNSLAELKTKVEVQNTNVHELRKEVHDLRKEVHDLRDEVRK